MPRPRSRQTPRESATRPPRKRSKRGKQAKARRALAQAVAAATEINVDAGTRQRVRANEQPNASLDTKLEDRYADYREDRRELLRAGVSKRSQFRGRTAQVGRGE